MEESWQTLASQLQELEEGIQVQLDQIAPSVTHYLDRDDHCLQNLAAMSALDASDATELRAHVAKLTAKLSDMNREEIECRLDRIYLQQLAGTGGDRPLQHGELEGVEVEQDLRSLHREIADVAAMSTFQEFKGPLLRAIAEQQNRKDERARAVLEDVCLATVGMALV